ncbi:MAG: hypothetical protein ABR608_11910 [Pseudonocardiaceae bacterium]
MTSTAGTPGRTASELGVGATTRGATTGTKATTETKASFKTTEFFAYLAAVVAVVITAMVVDGDANTADPFNAEQALRYLTFLTIGYMVSRGLAKAGSREPYTEAR